MHHVLPWAWMRQVCPCSFRTPKILGLGNENPRNPHREVPHGTLREVLGGGVQEGAQNYEYHLQQKVVLDSENGRGLARGYAEGRSESKGEP